MLTVDRQLVQMPRREPFHGRRRRRRPTGRPAPQVVVHVLAEHLRRYPAAPDGLVFTTETGGPIRRTSFSAVWRAAVAAAGEDGAVFHELHHYYASLLIRHGESVKVVQSRLGHATAAETLDTYAHLWPDSGAGDGGQRAWADSQQDRPGVRGGSLVTR
jgi:integrase